MFQKCKLLIPSNVSTFRTYILQFYVRYYEVLARPLSWSLVRIVVKKMLIL